MRSDLARCRLAVHCDVSSVDLGLLRCRFWAAFGKNAPYLAEGSGIGGKEVFDECNLATESGRAVVDASLDEHPDRLDL